MLFISSNELFLFFFFQSNILILLSFFHFCVFLDPKLNPCTTKLILWATYSPL